MAFKRGTPVTFVGPVGDGPCSSGEEPFLSKKYGVSIGDKGKVGCSKGGWTRVTWTRGDGSSAVSVPMRPCWLKEGHEVKQQAAVQPPTNTTSSHDPFEEAIKNGEEFVPYVKAQYKGTVTGYTFGTKWPGPPLGTGYYLDTRKVLLTKLRVAENANKELEAKISDLKEDVAASAERIDGFKEDVDAAAERIENMILSNDQEKQRRLQQLDRALNRRSGE